MFRKKFDLPTTTYLNTYSSLDDKYPATVPVPFSQFGKPAEDMNAGEFIKYYVRGVALKSSGSPGILDTFYSDTITVNYGFDKPIKYYSDSPYDKWEVPVCKPSLRIKSYNPVQWESKDYLSRYVVFRAPKADEINYKWKNVATGEFLYPYTRPYVVYYQALGINSKAEYESKIIPRVLKTNTKIYFFPRLV